MSQQILLVGAGMGGGTGAPKHVAVIDLAGNYAEGIIQSLVASATEIMDHDANVQWGRPISAHFGTYKQSMTFTLCAKQAGGDASHSVAAAKFADVIMLVLPVAPGSTGDVDGSVDCAGREFITALKASGVPSVVGVTAGAEEAGSKKAVALARKWGAAVFEEQFPGKHTKVADADNSTALLRALATVKPKPVAWLQHRPYLLVTGLHFTPTGSIPTPKPQGHTLQPQALVAAAVAGAGVPDPGAVEAFGRAYDTMPATMDAGELVISGYLRGAPVHVDGLVHVSGMGTFPVAAITSPDDPVASGGAGAAAAAADVQTSQHGPVVAEQDAAEVEDLSTLAEEDAGAAEQTWPTAEEEAAAAQQARLDKLTAATGSKIQAVWIDAVGEGDATLAEAAARQQLHDAVEADDDLGTVAESTAAPSKAALRAAAREAEREQLEFPDEVDTPDDMPARQRFGRFRGLRSFRSSPWDPKESLPRSYGRIYQLSNFQASQRAVFKDAVHAEAVLTKIESSMLRAERAAKKGGGSDTVSVTGSTATGGSSASEVQERLGSLAGEGWVPQGRYVQLVLRGVPAAVVLHRLGATPVVVTALMPHEQRSSIMQFNIMRVPTEPADDNDDQAAAAQIEAGEASDFQAVATERRAAIKSKDPLEFVIGSRRVVVRPVFSEHNLNCDKSKFEKFLHTDRWTMASVFAPIAFGNTPVLVYKLCPGGRRVLVATGNSVGADPDSIVLKRIILAGFPVKCKRRSAMVKYMFHNPEDIRYFKPVELWTKHGLVGRIKEPVGTHGSMKCHFSGSIYSHDTICMSLYKRVYPRWGESYRHLVGDAAMEASVGSTLAGPLGTVTGQAAHPLDVFMAGEQETDGEADLKLV